MNSKYNLHTKLCDLLHIDVPIIEAPMVESPRLVAAVSNAGGLGMLPLYSGPDEVRKNIQEIRKLTDKPFGVNMFVFPEARPHEKLKVCLDESVPIISFFWGDPSPFVKNVHDAGAIVLSTVASASEAKSIR